MARTATKMQLSDLPVESMEEKCNRYFKVTGSTEDDTKKLIRKYLNMLTSVDNDAQENERQGEENAKMVEQNEENARNASKNKKSKPVKLIKGEAAKKSGTKFKKITKEQQKIKGKLRYFVTKLKTTHYSETWKNTLKQYMLAEPRARDMFIDMIIATKDTYLQDKLCDFIDEMSKEAKNANTPTTSKALVNTENNNQSNTPDMATSFSDNKINGRRSTKSKDSPDSRKNPTKGKSHENKKQPKTPKTPKSLPDNDDSGRRRSLRLSTNPPGYFQTKPAMVIYMIPNGSSDIKRKSSSIKKLTNTVPKAKRRKLYNANSI